MTTENLDRDGVERRAAARGRKSVEQIAGRLKSLKMEYVPTDSIKNNDYNPNRQSAREWELMVASIRTNGFDRPILVQRATREIVDGEHRWRAARDVFKLAEVPVVFVDWSADKARISTLRHNRAKGSEDGDLVANLLRDLRELGALDYVQAQLDLTDEDLHRMIDDVSAPAELAGEEFSEAWVPTKNPASLVGKEGVDMTPGAQAAAEKAQSDLQNAKSEVERGEIEKRARAESLRVVATFSGDDAAVVRRVLGEKNKALRLLELARAELQRRTTAERQAGA